MVQSRYRFLEWMDLDNTGMLSECAILKKFDNGDVYFIPLESLDVIDKQRLKAILLDRNAQLYDELWKVLEQKTLGNGINALLYFNQLAKQLTPSGKVLPFGSNKRASGKIAAPIAPVGNVDPAMMQQFQQFQQQQYQQQQYQQPVAPVPGAQPAPQTVQVTPPDQTPSFEQVATKSTPKGAK